MPWSPFNRECEHCAFVNVEGIEPWPRCASCGHRADRPRLVCDCPKCDPRTCVLRIIEDDGYQD